MKHTHTHTHTHTQRQTDRQADRQTETETETDGRTRRDTDRKAEKETEGGRDGETERGRVSPQARLIPSDERNNHSLPKTGYIPTMDPVYCKKEVNPIKNQGGFETSNIATKGHSHPKGTISRQ